MKARLRNSKYLRAALPALWALISASPLQAHPGPHEEIARLDALIVAEPTRADMRVQRALQFRLAGRHDAALADLAEAEKLAPQDGEILLQRGLTLTEIGRDAEAEAALTRFLAAGAGSAVALAERGRVRERLGKDQDALADYEAAIVLDAQVELFLLRGEVQERLGRLDEAAAGYRVGLERFEADPGLVDALVRVEVARKAFDSALALVEAALATAPHRTAWLMRKADILDTADRAEEAQSAWLAALVEIDRTIAARPSAIHLVTRAEICLALGRVADAQRDIELALRKAPHYRAAQELQAKLPADVGTTGMAPGGGRSGP